MIKNADREAAYNDLISEGRQRLGEPPTEEEVLACLRGDLSAQESARVRELLVYYPELVRALEDSFPFPYEGKPGDADFLSAEELAQDWSSLQERVRASERTAMPTTSAPGGRLEPFPSPADAGERPRRSRRMDRGLPSWRVSAIAASLLSVLLGGLYLDARQELRRLAEELNEPRFNLEHRMLLPDGQRGGAAEQPPIPLPSEVDYFLLIPALINHPQYPDYQIEILDSNTQPQRVIWSGAGLRRRSDDTFEIWVPRAFLKPGTYELVVSGLAAGRKEPLASYTVRLSPD